MCHTLDMDLLILLLFYFVYLFLHCQTSSARSSKLRSLCMKFCPRHRSPSAKNRHTRRSGLSAGIEGRWNFRLRRPWRIYYRFQVCAEPSGRESPQGQCCDTELGGSIFQGGRRIVTNEEEGQLDFVLFFHRTDSCGTLDSGLRCRRSSVLFHLRAAVAQLWDFG